MASLIFQVTICSTCARILFRAVPVSLAVNTRPVTHGESRYALTVQGQNAAYPATTVSFYVNCKAASRKYVTIKYASSLKTYSFKAIFRSFQETDFPDIPPLSDKLGRFHSFLSSKHHWNILLQFRHFGTWQ